MKSDVVEREKTNGSNVQGISAEIASKSMRASNCEIRKKSYVVSAQALADFVLIIFES
jgi:hypothetical protein